MKEYYLTKRFASAYLGLSIVTLVLSGSALGWFLYANVDASRMWFCFVVYFLVLGIYAIGLAIYKAIFEHIAVSENGIEYHSPWTVLETKWSSIEKISCGWHNFLRIEGLLVHTSCIRITRSRGFYDRSGPNPFYSHKIILPLSCFSNNWRENELGRQIKQYAPALFT